MAWNRVLRVVCGVGFVACLVGLLGTFAVTTAAYPALDALFVGGAAMAIVPAMLIKN